MKILLLLIALVGVVTSFNMLEAEEKFIDFVLRYNNTKHHRYPEDYEHRLHIFANNLMEIQQHNSENVTWRKAINQFSDITSEEFNQIYGGGYTNIHRPSAASSNVPKFFMSSTLPAHKDWRDEGVITPVKNQGHCGSCWAHAGTQQLESYLKLETNSPLLELSVQQITSCTPNPMQCGGNGGCAGSITQFAFDYAGLIGVVSEEEYPYISGNSRKSEQCYYNATHEKAVAYVRGQETLQHNDYHAILNHIANVGPLAISVAATGWQAYGGGVFDDCPYDKNIALNHAVQLVGYGTDDEFGDYWLVRNSWGTSWGEDGYIRLARETTVTCGVNETPLSGSGCKDDGIKKQKVCGMCGVLFEAAYPIGTESTRHDEPDVFISQI